MPLLTQEGRGGKLRSEFGSRLIATLEWRHEAGRVIVVARERKSFDYNVLVMCSARTLLGPLLRSLLRVRAAERAIEPVGNT